jgi:hypothetical protein
MNLNPRETFPILIAVIKRVLNIAVVFNMVHDYTKAAMAAQTEY